MGFRHSTDVEHERIALKALRGDFRNIPTVFDKDDEQAVERMADEGGPGGPDITLANGAEAAQKVLEALKH